VNGAGTDIAFVNADGNVVHDWYNSANGWQGPASIKGTARAGSGMTQDDVGDTVVYVDPGGAVVNSWANPSKGWLGPAPIGGTSR
jgi:hypothetical protein